jgi:hypothetical protein
MKAPRLRSAQLVCMLRVHGWCALKSPCLQFALCIDADECAREGGEECHLLRCAFGGDRGGGHVTIDVPALECCARMW